jgi:hypothetical protein
VDTLSSNPGGEWKRKHRSECPVIGNADDDLAGHAV